VAQQDTAVLDFGSEKITALIGERGVNGTIRVKGMGVCNYAGFLDGEFLDPEMLGESIRTALSEASVSAGTRITRVYVGVPGEFSSVVCKEVSTTLNRKRKVKDADVFNLMSAGDNFDEKYEVINIQPIYYTLDNNLRVLSPLGAVSAKLGGVLSYIMAEKTFTDEIRKILTAMGVPSVEFVSSVLAESLILFDEDKRDGTAVLVDVGYLTTSVAIVKGDGLLSLRSFSQGGGHITGDLATILQIPFSDAELLKRKVILSIEPSEEDIYEINGKNGIKTFPAQIVNEIVAHRISVIARTISKCLTTCEYEYPDYIPYSLTGGGIAFMRGAKDAIANTVGREVEIVVPPYPQINKPNLSSAWGLLDMAIKNDEPVKKSFFAKIFKK
jgi:cell division protein FtsA